MRQVFMGFRKLLFVLVLTCTATGNVGWAAEAVVRVKANRGDGLTDLQMIQGAIESLRKLRGEMPNRRLVVLLEGGRYEIEKPIVITQEDSGRSAENNLLITAAPGAEVVISGGRKLTGWKRDGKNPRLWQLELPDVKTGGFYFRQLFINGERKQRARTPNEGYYRIQGESPQDKPVKIKFAGEEIKASWAGQGDVELIALLAWADIRMQIKSVDKENKVATLSGNPRQSNKEANARYYIENAPDGLDDPGEWYLNKQTGVLSYLAKNGEDLDKAEVIVPVTKDLVQIKGAPDKPVRHIAIRGLTFAHTDWEMPETGYADTQAAVATRGDLLIEYGSDISIEDCKFLHLAGYAIDLAKGAQRARIVGNEIRDIGGGGLRIGETARPASPAEENHSHLITDNHIHQLGRIFPPAVGIFIMQSATNRVAHNHIHDLFYTAVSVGWNWGYRESPCRENIIEFNHMHDIGQAVLSDMGAVYTLGPQHGTVVRNNIIHDVEAFKYGGWGLYTDEGSTGITMENNLVYRCKHAGFHQHYGRDNIIRNNIFAFNRESQVMRTRPEEHISFVFTNNIVYFDSGSLLGSNWSNDNYVMDYNIYFDARQPDATNLTFSGASFGEWQKRGHDKNSLIADPKFKDAAKNDFKLAPDSPALKLGFKPLNLENVGVRPKNLRT